MEVHLTPALQAKLDEWTSETGRRADELIEEAIIGFFDELDQVRGMLDNRIDENKNGRVQPISGTEALTRLREKSGARRTERRE